MKILMRKLLFTFMVLQLVVISNYIEVNAGYDESDSADNFSIEFCIPQEIIDLRDVDFFGIKVDVYSSELTMYDCESGISEFIHSYSFSAYSD